MFTLITVPSSETERKLCSFLSVLSFSTSSLPFLSSFIFFLHSFSLHLVFHIIFSVAVLLSALTAKVLQATLHRGALTKAKSVSHALREDEEDAQAGEDAESTTKKCARLVFKKQLNKIRFLFTVNHK